MIAERIDIGAVSLEPEMQVRTRRQAGAHDEADDLAQETFIKAYEALASFRADASFKTWLLRIATNLSINTTKSGRISKDCGQAPHEFSLTDHHHGDENLIHEQRALRLREAIKQLPPRQKEALMLKTYEDMTCEEVATVMECSVGTVKANVFNALKKIRSILGDMA